MKQIKVCFFALGLLVWGQVHALPAEHPANPEAVVPAFHPADYFVSQAANAKLAADEHQHDAVPAAAEPAAQDEAVKREHGESKGKGSGDMGMECMKMHGDTGMHDCPMMEKMMQQDGEKAAKEPETKKDEGHESHH